MKPVRREESSILIKEHVRLTKKLTELERERNELTHRRSMIYNELYVRARRATPDANTFFCLIDGDRHRVVFANGKIEASQLTFRSIDTMLAPEESVGEQQA